MFNNYNSHYNSYGSGSPGSLYARLDETAAVGLLQHLSKEDLQHLLNTDNKLSDLVQDLQQVRDLLDLRI
jgi:hypothetical protein